MERKINSYPTFGLPRIMAGFRRDPLGTMGALQAEYGDLIRFAWPVRTILIFHPDDIRDALNKFAPVMVKGRQAKELKGVTGNGLFTSEGTEWRTARRLIGNLFSASHVRGYTPTIETAVREHVARWPRRAPFDFTRAIKLCAFDIAGRLLFGGIDASTAPDVQGDVEFLGAALFRRIGSAFPLPLWLPTREHRRFRRATAAIDAIVYRCIADRRRSSTVHEDFLGRLLGGGTSLSDRQIRDEAVTLMVAGFETTATMTIWTLHLLSRHPEILRHLTIEAQGAASPTELMKPQSLIVRVLRESLRL